jgi:hypothetical protein
MPEMNLVDLYDGTARLRISGVTRVLRLQLYHCSSFSTQCDFYKAVQ